MKNTSKMLDDFVTMIKGPTVIKTIDPLYNDAKQALRNITYDPEQTISYIEQMEKSLQDLSSATYKLGEDIDHWFSDAPEDIKLEAKTNFSFTKHFSALTNNFLVPRAQTHVISLLLKYQSELEEIREKREEVKKLRKEFDKSQALVRHLLSLSEVDEDKMREAIKKMNDDDQAYSTSNSDFIDAVNNLKQEWNKKLEKPFINLLCITSQYMLQVFTELQKYRTTFPHDIFDQYEQSKQKEQNENNKDSNEKSNQKESDQK